jgi:hypothetical protein
MLRAGFVCSSIASAASVFVFNLKYRTSESSVDALPRYSTHNQPLLGVSQALVELESKGFCCIGPSAIPRTHSLACEEARSISFSACGTEYRPSAPRRFHRITFDDSTVKEFHDLEQSWLPLVNAFFEKCPPSLRSEQQFLVESQKETGNDCKSRTTVPRTLFYRSECQLIHTAPGAKAQFFHQDNMRRGLTVVVPLVDMHPSLGPTQACSLPFALAVLLHTLAIL